MMDPRDGKMTMINDETIKKMMEALERHGSGSTHPNIIPKSAVDDHPTQAMIDQAFPGQVLWREGEEIEVRGCWFRVSAVRRTRITLIPIARP